MLQKYFMSIVLIFEKHGRIPHLLRANTARLRSKESYLLEMQLKIVDAIS